MSCWARDTLIRCHGALAVTPAPAGCFVQHRRPNSVVGVLSSDATGPSTTRDTWLRMITHRRRSTGSGKYEHSTKKVNSQALGPASAHRFVMFRDLQIWGNWSTGSGDSPRFGSPLLVIATKSPTSPSVGTDVVGQVNGGQGPRPELMASRKRHFITSGAGRWQPAFAGARPGWFQSPRLAAPDLPHEVDDARAQRPR